MLTKLKTIKKFRRNWSLKSMMFQKDTNVEIKAKKHPS